MANGKTKASEQDWQTVKRAQISGVIIELSSRAPIQVAPHVKTAAPYLAYVVVLVMLAMPYVVQACSKAKQVLTTLPDKAIYAILGFAVCFFGGVFPATIAAVEAWQLCGGEEAQKCVKQLYEEAKKVQAANAEDEKKGEVEKKAVEPTELLLRKTQLVLRTVEPEAISAGLVGLWTGWIAVLAVLRHKFAKTVTLGERIGSSLYEPVKRCEPALAELMPEEYRKWVPVVVRWSCKIFAMTIAWWIQRVISAIHSAIKGGLIFGRILVEFLHEKGFVTFPPEKAYLDEAIGWGIAAVGLIFQFSWGFALPFPLNILLLPVKLVETFIIWSMAGGNGVV